MAVQVLLPSAPREKESALDKVLKGVQIANSILGGYANVQQGKTAVQARDIAKAQESDRMAGVVDADKVLQYGKEYNMSDAQAPGGLPISYRKDGEIKTQYATPRPKEVSPWEQVIGKLNVQAKQLDIAKTQGDITKQRADQNSPQFAFDRLPEENKKAITSIAQKNAGKAAIASQIDSVLAKIESDEVPLEMKQALGQGLLKTLNSSEGSDAVGAEEVKRLAPFLTPQGIKALWSPGKALSSDIPSFITQVKLTSSALKDAINTNNSLVDKLKAGGKIELDAPPEYVDQRTDVAKGGKPGSPQAPKIKVAAGNVQLEGTQDDILKQIAEARVRKNGIKNVMKAR